MYPLVQASRGKNGTMFGLVDQSKDVPPVDASSVQEWY